MRYNFTNFQKLVSAPLMIFFRTLKCLSPAQYLDVPAQYSVGPAQYSDVPAQYSVGPAQYSCGKFIDIYS